MLGKTKMEKLERWIGGKKEKEQRTGVRERKG